MLYLAPPPNQLQEVVNYSSKVLNLLLIKSAEMRGALVIPRLKPHGNDELSNGSDEQRVVSQCAHSISVSK